MSHRYCSDHFLFREMDLYANEYGDQSLIKAIEEWLKRKMGGEWHVQKKDHRKVEV